VICTVKPHWFTILRIDAALIETNCLGLRMLKWIQRTIIVTIICGGLTGCSVQSLNPFSGGSVDKLEASVISSFQQMQDRFPVTSELSEKAAGILIVPKVFEAGIGYGGAYGRGGLLINSEIVDYYSVASGSIGIQIGAQQSSHALFFMTQDALSDFRSSSGWTAGGEVAYATLNDGMTVRADTTTALADVLSFTFSQAGVKLAAVIEGSKYTKITQ
jgi:lipid-binding SYLF domain-containing protein